MGCCSSRMAGRQVASRSRARSAPGGAAHKDSGRQLAAAGGLQPVVGVPTTAGAPVPRPQTSSGGSPVSAASSAAAAVVLPMPSSPTHSTHAAGLGAPAAARRTASAPACSAASSSCRLIAAPASMLREPPGRTTACTTATPGAACTADISASTPTFTISSATSLAAHSAAQADLPPATARKTEAVRARG